MLAVDTRQGISDEGKETTIIQIDCKVQINTASKISNRRRKDLLLANQSNWLLLKCSAVCIPYKLP